MAFVLKGTACILNKKIYFYVKSGFSHKFYLEKYCPASKNVIKNSIPLSPKRTDLSCFAFYGMQRFSVTKNNYNLWGKYLWFSRKISSNNPIQDDFFFWIKSE